MAFCKNCGAQIDDNAVVCTSCGVAQNTAPAVVDKGGFGWGLLGWCVPIVGLILFLVWKDTKPKTAKAAGIGALVSVILGVVIYIATFALGFAGMAMGY
ncbi:MAG: zinc ribbon domain-containing protein [Oscillospiraceae bacterium]|nr:zinc ribbon domain-containing protein [Oscillospiraceae bacterium]